MSFPNVAEAFFDWDIGVELTVVRKAVVDFEVEEDNVADLIFRGVIQPIPSTKLLVKPEGQRQWQWWSLWTVQRLDLDTILKDCEGKTYRIMTQSNWSGGGYFQYEITQGANHANGD